MTAWLVETLIASTLLMAAVLLLRAPVRRAFGAQLAYALWALPVLRLILPPMPASWREVAATPVSQAGETITVLIVPAGEMVATSSTGWPIGLVVAMTWAAGAVLFLGWHAVSHRRFCRRLLLSATELEAREGIRVIASDAAPGPLAFGIWRRYVAFPRDFADRYDPQERALALDHELGHHARGDLIANWIALAVLAIHWFSPVAWRAFRAFRIDQELANDARVLTGRSRADRHVYACAIVKTAHGGAVSAACHLHTIDDLKGRLKMLTVSRTSRHRLALGGATVGLLGLIGLGVTVSGSQAAAAITDKVGETVAAQIPVLPAPPAPPMATPDTAATEKRMERNRVVVVKDGDTKVYEGADADAYIAANDLPVPPLPPLPPIVGEQGVPKTFIFRRDKDGKPLKLADLTRLSRGPDGKPWTMKDFPGVVSMNCAGDESEPVIENEKDGRKRIIICTNRMETMSRNAQLLALNASTMEQHARGTARASLTMARSAIERDRNLSEEQRAQALAGIAQAEAELASAK